MRIFIEYLHIYYFRYILNCDKMLFHHRKHKVKHKKKHKEERKHKTQSQQQQEFDKLEQKNMKTFEQQHQNHEDLGCIERIDGHDNPSFNVLQNGDSRFIKEQCLKQKLSISLKRLNTNAYARCDYMSNASSSCKSPGNSSDELLSEHEHDETRSANPLPLKRCLTSIGTEMDVGAVVWGKVHGFPWWPGKVCFI